MAEDSQNVAVRIAALDTLCTLLGLLGEVLPEALPSLQQPIQHQLISSHSCLRHQVLAGLWVPRAVSRLLVQQSLRQWFSIIRDGGTADTAVVRA